MQEYKRIGIIKKKTKILYFQSIFAQQTQKISDNPSDFPPKNRPKFGEELIRGGGRFWKFVFIVFQILRAQNGIKGAEGGFTDGSAQENRAPLVQRIISGGKGEGA